MNKMWNSLSNSIMIEWKKWIVKDKYVIDDNGRLEYGFNGMIINSSTNEYNDYCIKMIWYKT